MRAPKNSQMVIAVVVAFVLGAGAGFFVELQRLKNKTHKAAPPKTATAARWFATPTKACPALKSWEATATASYVALLKKTPWPTTRTALLAQTTASHRGNENAAAAGDTQGSYRAQSPDHGAEQGERRVAARVLPSQLLEGGGGVRDPRGEARQRDLDARISYLPEDVVADPSEVTNVRFPGWDCDAGQRWRL